jgi:LysR family transcriptional regulator, transcriptional activator of nhaA
MSNWINYHHLYYFKTIAEEKSVSKAAAKLRLGQPTLSSQLKQFEEALGYPLFERQHKKLILTEQGKVALEYARSIFKLGNEMQEVLKDRAKPTRPTLCVASLDSIPKQLVLEIVQAALKIAPCQITLLEGRSDELLRELAAHRVDLLLTNFLPTALAPKGLFHRRVAKNRVSFYGAPKFKKLRKGFPESLLNQPVILPTYDSKLRYDLEHWAKMFSVNFDTITESQDISVKKLMAINGLGLLPVASHSVTRQILTGELIEIGRAEGIQEELLLVSAERKIANRIAKELMRTFSV